MRGRDCVLAALAIGVFGLGCDPGSKAPDMPDDKDDPALPKVCDVGTIRMDDDCLPLPQIKVDTVGYLPERAKFATVPDTVDGTSFELREVDSDKVVYEAELSDVRGSEDTGDAVRLADFTEFRDAGRYVLVVAEEVSPPFSIGEKVYDDALKATMLGFYGQRCGVEIDFEYDDKTYHHDACHLEDADTAYLARDSKDWVSKKKSGVGGWHDAGDYGKYTVNAAFSVAFLLKAWEDFGDVLSNVRHIPNHDDELPAWLDEAKFQLDQLLSMQFPDGSASHMIGPAIFPPPPVPAAGQPTHPDVASFAGTVLPEFDLTQRAFASAGTVGTAALSAALAMAARVFQPFDSDYASTCLAAARAAWDFLASETETPAVPNLNGFTHDAYGARNDAGNRLWAAVELWRATNDPSTLADAEATLGGMTIAPNWDWANLDPIAAFDYLQGAGDGRNQEVLENVKEAVIASAEKLVEGTEAHAYGRGIGAMYYWGSNGVLVRSVMNLLVANFVAPDSRYLDAAIQQLDYVFGRNPFGRSMVTGVGYLPPMAPHHRPSTGDSVRAPWPGLLVGGPNPNNHPLLESLPDRAPGLFWFDDAGDYTTNEVAINWNAPLAYALAAFHR